MIHADTRQRPALHHQRVDGVLTAKEMHPAKETYRGEEPPYGVSGAAGGDENADRRAARNYNHTPERELEGGSALVGPVQDKEHEA